MSDNQMISVPRDEVERLVKLLQYQAHPYPSPHAEFWQGLLDKPATAASVQRFWSCDAQNIRCVREADYDALDLRLINAEAGLAWESERNSLLLASLTESEDEFSLMSLEAGQRIDLLEGLLRNSGELFLATEDDLGAISASAVGVMRVKITAALTPAEGGGDE